LTKYGKTRKTKQGVGREAGNEGCSECVEEFATDEL